MKGTMDVGKAHRLLLVGILSLSPALIWRSLPAAQNSQQAAPDNSKQNQDRSTPTADQQKLDNFDRRITQDIRKSIVADKGLSTYAHNVKVITQNGKVTFRGPVRS